jgi:hypothetical protein
MPAAPLGAAQMRRLQTQTQSYTICQCARKGARWLFLALKRPTSNAAQNGTFDVDCAERTNRLILTSHAAAHVSRRPARTSLTSARLASRMEVRHGHCSDIAEISRPERHV